MLKDELLDFGFSENEYKKIMASHRIKEYTDDNLSGKFKELKDYFSSLGYTKEEIIKIVKDTPLVISLNVDGIKDKFNHLVTVGYKDEEVCKMWKKFPTLITLSEENVDTKIDDMIEMGYTKEEILEMTRGCPTIYSYSSDSMSERINKLVSLGYTKEESLAITKGFSDIFGLTTDRIKEKIEFYDSIGLHELAIEKSKNLMQSVELSYARYKFYEGKGYNIDMSNYRLLFMETQEFKNRYGMTKEELLKLYDYSKYKEKEKTNKKEM